MAEKLGETLAALQERAQSETASLTAIRLASRLVEVCCLLLACAVISGQVGASEIEPDQATLAWMQSVMGNWEAACRRHLRIAVQPVPWVIFYDQNYAWHLNPEQELLPTQEKSTASLKYAGQSYPLWRLTHSNSAPLWVPGRDALRLTQPEASAMPYADDQKFFCIIPLPALFHIFASADQAAAEDELFLGAALHELTHTRQLGFIQPQLNRLRASARIKLPDSLNDDLIEDTFRKNESYKHLYEEERDHLFRAVRAMLADDLATCYQETAQALAISQQRKHRFMSKDQRVYSGFEDVFLSLEGVAMWVHYQMALDHAPPGQDWFTTLGPIAERSAAWSQEEGAGLFMLIDRLVPGWQARFLALNPPSPFTVLREVIRKRSPLNNAMRSRNKKKSKKRMEKQEEG